MKQALNPYLPEGEYIPDAEPYLFGDRVYVYGSHDKFGAHIFCANDYVCYSAPVDDLSDWRYEGVIYRKDQDPKNRWGIRLLFAPDVVQGTDDRFYLYYAFDIMGIMGVAVSESPAGPYEFYGHVHYSDGTIWGRRKGDDFPFDPGVLVDDDGKIYLYSGFYQKINPLITGGKCLKSDGGVVLELEKDMVTIKTPAKLLFPKKGEGAFGGHEFFEASSIRKYDGMYYFVYSSRHNHELCYAYSTFPDREFIYGGTLVSNGDLFLDGVGDEKNARNYIGNNHGGMLRLGDDFYIFYHRHTYRNSYARQTCCEPLHYEKIMDENGTMHYVFQQSEMTSCGLNKAPLEARENYSAAICCNLWSSKGTRRYDKPFFGKLHPYIRQDRNDGEPNARQYIANFRQGAVCGFKYFLISDEIENLSVEVSGKAQGELMVYMDPERSVCVGMITVLLEGGEKRIVSGRIHVQKGICPLYLTYKGKGAIEIWSFYFS